ncbi:peptidase inhibitor family I36 protein [Nostoc sp. FACHB-152]|uniref:beta/gamma crystallin-related protein n=1 Tax=unclassified Nostoc TaxID=2593658 RepID=UPI0016823E22|nr:MULTISPECIES: beta/gamma crystallin-related protein [unclassified Nostoc]MBD2451907.1 peptidase inhibitor family I36 protein [Nostoc sp. FACHB-152]MBD2472473.1 peptidase inhibitor family I36 protein [Nostoc sp. FACHB-145]
MVNNQSSSLCSIHGLEDISQENAAACSGGTITIYDAANLQGTGFTFNSSVGDLRFTKDGNLNDRISSVRVDRFSEWELFIGVGFRGDKLTLRPGIYNLSQFPGGFNNEVSSLRRIG